MRFDGLIKNEPVTLERPDIALAETEDTFDEDIILPEQPMPESPAEATEKRVSKPTAKALPVESDITIPEEPVQEASGLSVKKEEYVSDYEVVADQVHTDPARAKHHN